MSSRNLNDCEKTLQEKFLNAKRDFLLRRGKWLDVLVVGTLRSDAEQRTLYWSSRTELSNGKIIQIKGKRHVTFLDGIVQRSKHQADENGLSRAIDFCFVRKSTGKADWTTLPLYFTFGRFLEKEGLVWGGRFKGFRDLGHCELK